MSPALTDCIDIAITRCETNVGRQRFTANLAVNSEMTAHEKGEGSPRTWLPSPHLRNRTVPRTPDFTVRPARTAWRYGVGLIVKRIVAQPAPLTSGLSG